MQNKKRNRSGVSANDHDMIGDCIMSLPKDPFILFSYVNTQLRDTGATLAEFCAQYGVSEDALKQQLSAAGFRYDEAQNRFR